MVRNPLDILPLIVVLQAIAFLFSSCRKLDKNQRFPKLELILHFISDSRS
ncbi:MAG: hypothetical protein ACFB02_10655 [Mastigocoleus sp.]